MADDEATGNSQPNMVLQQNESVSTQTLDNYRFPTHRLKQRQLRPERTPLVLVACGSFSPITYLHLRMFEMAADQTRYYNTEFEVMGGYLSPVSDFYKKAGLANSTHRLRMCELAVETSSWLMVDPWEALQTNYMPTAKVLDHVDYEINTVLGGVEGADGVRKPVRIALLAGADLIQTMSSPGVWSQEDLDHILGRYGTFIVERSGTDIDSALEALSRYKDNVFVIEQLVKNDVSSTKIRMFLRREMSVQYLMPASVIEYIEENGLYEDDGASSMDGKGKSKSDEAPDRAPAGCGSEAGKS